jgi:hypothetical protein
MEPDRELWGWKLGLLIPSKYGTAGCGELMAGFDDVEPSCAEGTWITAKQCSQMMDLVPGGRDTKVSAWHLLHLTFLSSPMLTGTTTSSNSKIVRINTSNKCIFQNFLCLPVIH